MRVPDAAIAAATGADDGDRHVRAFGACIARGEKDGLGLGQRGPHAGPLGISVGTGTSGGDAYAMNYICTRVGGAKELSGAA